MWARTDPKPEMERTAPGTFIGLRIALLSSGVTMSAMAILSLFPMGKLGEDGTFVGHRLAELLLPVNQVVFCVHLLILAAAETGYEADEKLAGHVLLKLHVGTCIIMFLACTCHCIVVGSFPPLAVVLTGLLFFSFMYRCLADLRKALRRHYRRTRGISIDHLATDAIKRGAAVLGILVYQLTESLACVGNNGSLQYVRRHCNHTNFNLFAMIALAFAFLFEVMVVDTGIATHHELLRFDSNLRPVVRTAAAVTVWLCVQMFVLWAARYNVPLSRENPDGEMEPVTLNWTLCGAPLFGLLVAFPTLMYHIPWLMEDSEKRKQSAIIADPEAGSAQPGGDEKSSNLGGKAERAMSALAVGTVLVGG